MMQDIKWNNLRNVLERYAEAWIKNAEANLMKNDSNASGALQRSMVLNDIVIDDKNISVTIELEDYWYYVEHGRGAGKMPPIEPIVNWIESKPVPPKVEGLTVKQRAFAIARAIGKNGTKPRPFFEKATKQTYSQFKEDIAEAIQMDIMEYIETDVLPKLKKLVGAD
jgi:hypothetical protein